MFRKHDFLKKTHVCVCVCVCVQYVNVISTRVRVCVLYIIPRERPDAVTKLNIIFHSPPRPRLIYVERNGRRNKPMILWLPSSTATTVKDQGDRGDGEQDRRGALLQRPRETNDTRLVLLSSVVSRRRHPDRIRTHNNNTTHSYTYAQTRNALMLHIDLQNINKYVSVTWRFVCMMCFP